MRTMVKAGSVKVGDMLNGRVVTGLGKIWTLDNEENCAWGAEPWQTVRVQYAYMDEANAAPARAQSPAASVQDLRAEADRLWAASREVASTKQRRALWEQAEAVEARIKAMQA